MRSLLSLVCLSFVLAGNLGRAAAAEPADLLPMFPENFNSVAVVRVKEALATKRAAREGWQADQSSDFLAGAVPPWIDLLVRVSHIHPGQGMDGQWSAALVESTQDFSLPEIAGTEKGTPEMLRETPVVMTNRNSYFVGLQPKLLGIYAPAYRQDVGNWIDRVRTKKTADIVGYLDDALKQTRGHVVLAMDCRDLFEPSFIRYRLEGAKGLQGKSPTDVQTMETLFRGLRGVRSQVTIDETIQWEVALDFDQPVGAEATLVRDVFAEFLDDMGTTLDEVAGALVSTEGNSVVLRAELSDFGLRRIMTLITSPQGGRKDVAKKNPDRDYFVDLEKILNDLQGSAKKASDAAKVASWCENYAKKIERSSTTGVDPMLINYGQTLATRLRALGASLRGTKLQVDTLQNSVTWDVHYQPGYVSAGWWSVGYQPDVVNTTSNLREVREKQAQAVLAGQSERESVWAMIDADREGVRRKLRAKYGAAIDSWK